MGTSVDFGNSSGWKSGSENEWSIDMESILFIQSTCWLFLWLLHLVSISDGPFLVDLVVEATDNDILTITISSKMHAFVRGDVAEGVTSVSEELPPS
jgi:hypothetical protein